MVKTVWVKVLLYDTKKTHQIYKKQSDDLENFIYSQCVDIISILVTEKIHPRKLYPWDSR